MSVRVACIRGYFDGQKFCRLHVILPKIVKGARKSHRKHDYADHCFPTLVRQTRRYLPPNLNICQEKIMRWDFFIRYVTLCSILQGGKRSSERKDCTWKYCRVSLSPKLNS